MYIYIYVNIDNVHTILITVNQPKKKTEVSVHWDHHHTPSTRLVSTRLGFPGLPRRECPAASPDRPGRRTLPDTPRPKPRGGTDLTRKMAQKPGDVTDVTEKNAEDWGKTWKNPWIFQLQMASQPLDLEESRYFQVPNLLSYRHISA